MQLVEACSAPMGGRVGANFTRTWHSEADATARKRILTEIFQILSSKATSRDQYQKLQTFSKRLETALYRNAPSLAEYQDSSTLRARVSAMAKTLTNPQAQQDRAQPVQSSRPAQPDSSRGLDEQPFAHTSALRGGSMPQGAAVMIPAPASQSSQWMRSTPHEDGAPARMMPTPTLDGAGSSTPWSAPGYSSAPVMADSSGYAHMGDPRRQPQQNGRTPHPGGGGMMGGAHGAISPVPGPSTSPSNNGNAHSMPSNQSTATTQQAAQQARQEQFRNQILKQQRLLLFLRHCAKCKSQNCTHARSCATGKELWHHIVRCSNEACDFQRCVHARELLRHYQKCSKTDCPICGPVRKYVENSKASSRMTAAAAAGPGPGSMQLMQPGGAPGMMHGGMGQAPQMLVSGPPGMMAPGGILAHSGSLQNGLPHSYLQPPPMQGGYMAMNGVQQGMRGVKREPEAAAGYWAGGGAAAHSMLADTPKRMRTIKQDVEVKKDMADIKKNLGASLLETFSVPQIDEHLRSTAEDMGRTPVPKGSVVAGPAPDEQCHVCKASHILRFEPPPKNCGTCGNRIKRNQTYFQHMRPDAIWCQSCFTAGGEHLYVENVAVAKEDVAKGRKKNEQHEDEAWVGCDSPNCNKWVHMICGLFNKGSNSTHTCYLCPWCLREEKERGRWDNSQPRPQSMATAKDLPTTQLSDHIEQRIGERVAEDTRMRRAGAGDAEAPRIEGLTVRVVNITDKVAEVKTQFQRHFGQAGGYPDHFPFKQKVLLLFQTIEGVDVLLFIVYVQEYGAECGEPNRNTCYLSYLDSVKYFRPEAKRAGNEGALRTMIYHEVLLGYMEHAKRLGMNAMYIWSCPPLAGDDYVIYCHPSKQKNPRASHLRDWYHTLLDEAARRGIVTFRSTLFDSFFEGGKDHALAAATSRNLPYFDGDFWPGEAETQLNDISTGKAPAGNKKGRGKATGKGKRYPGPVTTDQQLMQRLADHSVGSNQNGMKEDFIVAHFRTPCSLCAGYCDAVSWVLNKPASELPRAKQFDGIDVDDGTAERPDVPRHFAVCASCHAREAAGGGGAGTRLPKQVTLADLKKAPCAPVAAELRDGDGLKVCDIFDSRTSYLNLCQTQNLQFDTLRRAKHSSMMSLFHLHNPDHPGYPSTCSFCNGDVMPGQGYRCDTCSDLEACAACYQSGKTAHHPHPLTKVAKTGSKFTSAKSPNKRREREEMLSRTMKLLEHASSCNSKTCQSKSCRKVKRLHAHARVCEQKVSGGCALCKHMWCLLNLHAKQCVKRECPVPRCQELRELRRRQHARQEEARRDKYLQWQRDAARSDAGAAGGVPPR